MLSLIAIIYDEDNDKSRIDSYLNNKELSLVYIKHSGTPITQTAALASSLILLVLNRSISEIAELAGTIRDEPELAYVPILTIVPDHTPLDDFALSRVVWADVIPESALPHLYNRVMASLRDAAMVNVMRLNEERYSLTMSATTDGFLDWDIVNGSVYCSPRWRQILGITDDTLIRTPDDWFSLVHPRHAALVEESLKAHLKGRSSHFSCEYQILHRNGSYIWVHSRGCVIRKNQGEPIRFSCSLTNITEHKTVEEAHKRALTLDEVTGLPNRLALSNAIHVYLEQTCRQGGLSLLAISFEKLDQIKGSLGYSALESILVSTAERLRDIAPAQAFIARLGDNAFAICLWDQPSGEYSEALARTILRNLDRKHSVNDVCVYAHPCIGVAHACGAETTPEELIRNADNALLRSFFKGINTYHVYDKTFYDNTIAIFANEAELHEAVLGNGIVPYYQPIIDMKTQFIVGCEVLIRWKRADGRIVTPDNFIDLLERNGKIVEVGDKVLRDACLRAKEWRNRYKWFSLISVNVSGRQLSDERLYERIVAAVEAAELEPQVLAIEITETSLIDNLDLARNIIDRCRDYGVRVSIDDFGTSYSSLHYLYQFAFTTLKIDKSFVQAMLHDRKAAIIVQASIYLAHLLNVAVVAEGVETEGQAAALRVLKCDYGQGYLYSKPVPNHEMCQLLQAQCDLVAAHADG